MTKPNITFMSRQVANPVDPDDKHPCHMLMGVCAVQAKAVVKPKNLMGFTQTPEEILESMKGELSEEVYGLLYGDLRKAFDRLREILELEGAYGEELADQLTKISNLMEPDYPTASYEELEKGQGE